MSEKAGSKDRWLAGNLSWTIPGFGQLYAGKFLSGIAFLLIEIGIWTGIIAWFLSPTMVIWSLLGLAGAALLVRVVSLIHVVLSLPPLRPPAGPNPWLALFLTRLFPGIGHLYARRWIRAGAILGLVGLAIFWKVPEDSRPWHAWIVAGVGAVVLVDAFWVLRRNNLVSRGGTRGSLLFLILMTESIWLGETTRSYLLETFRIPSTAMSPTLRPGDRILVRKFAFGKRQIRRFDVIVFRSPLVPSRFLVSRVVGLPGEEICFEYGEIFYRKQGEESFHKVVKPRHLEEVYYESRERMAGRAQALKIPPGSIVVVGDNTSSSYDSRGYERRILVLKDGRTIVCDRKEVIEESEKEILAREWGLETVPDTVIREDSSGRRHTLARGDIVSDRDEPFPFIPTENVLGHVDRIWWPPSRQVPVR